MYISIEDLPQQYREQAKAQIEPKKLSKYRNEKTKCGKIVFDSKKEAERFGELLSLFSAQKITDLKLQHTFVLQEAYTTPNGDRIRAITYKADFTYRKDGNLIVEDVKSPITRKKSDYRIKVKMMREKFGIDVVEV